MARANNFLGGVAWGVVRIFLVTAVGLEEISGGVDKMRIGNRVSERVTLLGAPGLMGHIVLVFNSFSELPAMARNGDVSSVLSEIPPLVSGGRRYINIWWVMSSHVCTRPCITSLC